jgi:hypothetical protein
VTRTIRGFAACTGLAAGLWLTATAAEMPAGVVDKVIEGDIAFLQKNLDKTPEKRAIPTIKATAILLAGAAQDGLAGANGEKMAGVRAGALKVAEAMAKKDYAAAKAAAAGIKDAKATDKKPIDLSKQAKISLEEVMSTFRKGTVGGRNIEADLKAQVKALSDVGLAGEIGARSALIADLTEKLPPAGASGAKLKQWQDLSIEMKQIASDLAGEAGKSGADKKKVTDLLKKLEKNCTDCHNKYRDN